MCGKLLCDDEVAPSQLLVEEAKLEKFKFTATSSPCSVTNKCYVKIDRHIVEDEFHRNTYHGKQTYCYSCVKHLLSAALKILK
jgi:hypothetical protein